MKKFLLGLGWVFGVLFILSGLGALLNKQWIASFGFLLAGCLLLPYTQNIILSMSNNKITKKTLVIMAIISFFVGAILQPEKEMNQDIKDKNNQNIEKNERVNLEEKIPANNTPVEHLQEIVVPSDAKAKYELVSSKHTKSGIEVLTKRTGPSGVSFALRFYDCKGNFKYLGEGDTQAEAEARNSKNSKMSGLTEGSISTYVGEYACDK